jgi:hypothetical protein
MGRFSGRSLEVLEDGQPMIPAGSKAGMRCAAVSDRMAGKPATASQALDLFVQSFSDGVNCGMPMVIRA